MAIVKARHDKEAAVGNMGLIGAVGIGVAAVLIPVALVWALVVAGLREAIERNAHIKRPKDVQFGKVER